MQEVERKEESNERAATGEREDRDMRCSVIEGLS
jgi:hypothetical protein